MLNIVATDPANGNTGREVRTVVSNAPTGTLLFERTTRTLDDQRARQLRAIRRRPTSTPGAYDMEQFQVFGRRATGSCSACATAT